MDPNLRLNEACDDPQIKVDVIVVGDEMDDDDAIDGFFFFRAYPRVPAGVIELGEALGFEHARRATP